ncbi:MAG TPA: hypothetical protein VFI31_19660 [Pirellulales bacterium]|nr:hypothetical protein [Pirellulales bacterium]
METNDQEFRQGLLGQLSPETDRLNHYRKEMTNMIEENERGLRREKRWIVVLWLYGVAIFTAYLLISGFYHPTPERVWIVGLVSMGSVLFYGGLELLKHFINRSRVEILKELKQLELRVLELDERVGGQG